MTLDRKGIASAFKSLFETDTTILYGSGKYIQTVGAKPIMFSKAKVNNNNPNALYIWVESQDTIDERMQNGDVSYTLNMRFESLYVNPEDAVDNIDNAIERVNYLVNEEMRNGQNLSAHYTDSNAQIINIEPISSVLPPPVENNNRVIVEIEGAILAEVNRWS